MILAEETTAPAETTIASGEKTIIPGQQTIIPGQQTIISRQQTIVFGGKIGLSRFLIIRILFGNYSVFEKNRGEPSSSRSATVDVSTGCARRAARQIKTSKN